MTIRQSAHDSTALGPERAQTLAKLNGTLAGWLDLLRLCKADDTDALAFLQITEEVALFKDWGDEARLALALLQDARSKGSTRYINALAKTTPP